MKRGANRGFPLKIENLFLTTDPDFVTWEAFRDGIEICRLHSEPDGSSSALLRYAPGARLGRHRHVGYEHIIVLRGSQIDDDGEHPAGTLLIHAPGSCHAIVSPDGCIVLAIWEKGVQFLPADEFMG